jgi:hypothetical protein
MGISPGKSTPDTANRASGLQAFQQSSQRSFKSLQRKILYPLALLELGALLALALALASVTFLAPVLAAQEQRPQITPGERKVAKKKESGPRALGVLRITSTGKATLVPITILLEGKFYDASAYKAAPVPMALYTGTVYEGERTGNSLGLFTVDGALHSNAASSQTPWIGAGSWVLAGKEVAKSTIKAENVPVGIDNSGDAPPRLTRSSPSSENPPSSAPPSTTPPSTVPSTTTPPSTAPPATTSKPNTPDNPAGSPAKDASAAPAKEKDKDKEQDSDSNSGAGDNNRPRLRRGKPVDPLPEEEIPGYSKIGATPASTPASPPTPPADPAKPAAAPAIVPVQLIPAISDAGGPEPRSFTFEWLKGEEDERRQQVIALAKQEIRTYMAAQAKANIPAKPSPKTTARGKAPKPPDPILDNPQMVTYDLWTNNQPVIVFSADAHLPPSAARNPPPAANADLQYSITLVVRTDIYNNLHKMYVGITDKYHLDLTPRLQLVDAVDADGDGRGELLFRETSDSGAGWVIYRATTDKLWKLFDSLNLE